MFTWWAGDAKHHKPAKFLVFLVKIKGSSGTHSGQMDRRPVDPLR